MTKGKTLSVSEIDRQLGRRMSQAREASGLDRQEMASQIDIEVAKIAGMEDGQLRVSALVLARVAGALETPVSWFYRGLPGQDVFEGDPIARRSV